MTPSTNPATPHALSRRQLLAGSAAAAGGAVLFRPAGAGAAQPHHHPAAPPPSLQPASSDADGRPYSDTHWDRPGEPGRVYTPVITPNGSTLPLRIVDGVKVFHLIAEEVDHEFAPGLRARCWGYNGSVHGPTIEAVEGDRVRIYVTNRLPAPTSVHWHGILLPSGMDGVAGLSHPAIAPGETYVYEFTLRQHGTHFYHPHHDEMTQMAMGMMGLLIIHPRRPAGHRPERDFAYMLSEWRIDPGTARPNPNEMLDFNLLTFNGRAFPGTDPLVAALGQHVRLRFANGSATNHHPIHLHGFRFLITETDGGQIPESAQWPETTVLVPIGSTRTVDFVADNPGDWALHCHMTHHTMNQMGHEFPNMLGVDTRGLDQRIRPLIPGYMTMGQTGMGDMAEHIAMGHMPPPENSIPMVGGDGPHGYITMGGMFTVLKVRDGMTDYHDPGWYRNPEGTQARAATAVELGRDGVGQESRDHPAHDHDAAPPAAPASPGHHHGHH